MNMRCCRRWARRKVKQMALCQRDRPPHDVDEGYGQGAGAISDREIRLEHDEGNRPDSTLADLQSMKPVFQSGQKIAEGKFITARNASQLSDGAAAVVVMNARKAEKRGVRRSVTIAASRLRRARVFRISDNGASEPSPWLQQVL
jgi:hypothetical protein